MLEAKEIGGTKALIYSRVKKAKNMRIREAGRGRKTGKGRSLNLIPIVMGRH